MKKFNVTLFIIFFSFFIGLFGFDDWQQTNGPKNEEGNYVPVYSLVIDANDKIYAGTSGYGIYSSTDGGNTWLHIWDSFASVWKLLIDNNGNLFAATEYDGIWRSTDNGDTWSLSLDIPFWVTAINKSPDNVIIAASELGKVYSSDDSGENWSLIWEAPSSVFSLAIDSDLNIYAGVVGEGVYKSTDMGMNWDFEALAGNFVWDLLFTDNNSYLFAGTEEDGLWRLDLNSQNWEQVGFSNQAINTIAVNSQGNLAVGSYGTDIYISDENLVWYPKSEGLPETAINGIAFDSEGYLYAGLFDNAVAKTTISTFVPTLEVPSLMSYTCAGTNHTFSVVANNAYYADNVFNIELSDNMGSFENATVIGTINASSSTDIDITIPPNAVYSSGYRFRAVSTSPVFESEMSGTFTISPLKPNLSAPENNAVDQPLSTTLYWVDLIDCVSKYRLLVDDNEDFLTPVAEEFELTGSPYQIPFELQSNTRYYWKVAGVKYDGVYAYSDVYSFTTLSRSIELTTYSNSVCAGTNESVYYNVSGVFGEDNEFKIELSDENGNFFDTPTIIGSVLSQESGHINVTIPNTLIHSFNYLIRVISTNPVLTSIESDAIEIKSIKPELLLPNNNEIEVSRMPILEWSQPSDCVSTYRLLVDDNEDFLSPIVEEFGITSNYYEFITNLPYNKKYYWKVAGINSQDVYTYSDVFNFTTEVLVEQTRNISLVKGWNLISLNVVPNAPNMVDIFQAIRSKIIIAKNSSGNIYLSSNNFNTIGNWVVSQAYQVYANEACTLSVTGMPVIPEETPINFTRTGWHYVSYLRTSDMPIASALTSLTSLGKMTITKNNTGLIYMGISPFLNSIVTIRVGQGYQIYINSTGTLTYPAND